MRAKWKASQHSILAEKAKARNGAAIGAGECFDFG
jgi:hypothetical protein